MSDEVPPALESTEREEDEDTVTEDDEKGSDGELTEDEPLLIKKKKAAVVVQAEKKRIRKPAGEAKKALKKEKWQSWSSVKSKYVPDPVANGAQFAELPWKKRAEYIEKLRIQYQKTNLEHRVRRLPLLDLRNYWLYLENERFDQITGGKKTSDVTQQHEKENEDEKGGRNNDSNGHSSSNNSSHKRKKSPVKKSSSSKSQDSDNGSSKWTNAEEQEELFMIGNRISFVPSPSANLRPTIQQRRADGKYLLVDLDTGFEQWVDLYLKEVIEYTEVVWAKLKGQSWWPAQVLREVKMGKPTKRTGNLMVELCGSGEVSSVKYANVCAFEGCVLDEIKDKKKALGFDQALRIATRLWKEHTNNVTNFEHKRKKNIMETARDNASPASLLQTKIKVYWALDHVWYVGTLKQYHLQTGKHFILYEDGQKEWLSLAEETFEKVADEGEEGGASDYSKIVLDPAVRDEGDTVTNMKYNSSKCWECGHSGTRVAGWELDPQDDMTSCVRCGAMCHIRCFHLSRSTQLLKSNALATTTSSPSSSSSSSSSLCSSASSSANSSSSLSSSSSSSSASSSSASSSSLMTDVSPSSSSSLHADADPSKARCRQCTGCETCGQDKDPHKLLTCGVCHFRVHYDCLDPKLSALPLLNTERGGWVCDFCVKCRSCNANSYTGETVKKKLSVLDDIKKDEEKEALLLLSEEKQSTNNSDKKEEKQEEKKGESVNEEKMDFVAATEVVEPVPQKVGRKRGRAPKQPAAAAAPRKRGKAKKFSEDTSGALSTTATTASTAAMKKEDEGKIVPLWRYDYTVCAPCGQGYVKGEFCPICFVVWHGEGTRPMICCDACGRWVHVECDGMTEAVLQVLEQSHRIYHCPECVHRDKLSDLGGLLDNLAALDTNSLFCFPVSESEAPGYLEVIKSPMDFVTIQAKLRDCAYTSTEDFKYDLNLVWRNAKDYNRPNTSAYKAAIRLATVAAKNLDKLSLKWTKAHRELRSLDDGEDTDEEVEEKAEAVVEVKETPLVQSWTPYYNYFTKNPEVMDADTCLACGSLGDWDYLLFCADCGEATHSFCIYALLELNSERRSGDWRCPNCVTCGTCQKCDVDDTLLVCDICDAGRHLQCANPALTTVPSGGFKCDSCVKCKSCGTTKAGKTKKDQWMYNFTLCRACGLRYAKGKYCPVCDKVWQDNEGEMVECDRCSSWVHTKCDDIDAEHYAELNGQTVYLCPNCRKQSAKKVVEGPPLQGTLSPWELRSLIARIQFRRRRVRRRLLVNARRRVLITRAVEQMDPQDKQYVSIKNPFEIWTDFPDVHSKLKRIMDDLFLPHGPCLPVETLPLSKCVLSQRVREKENESSEKHSSSSLSKLEKPVPTPELVFPRKTALFAPTHAGGTLVTHSRSCKFCGGTNEEGVEGRMLPYEDMWVHVNCCLWAVECNESKHGEIANIDRALNKSTFCGLCQIPGARIRCREKHCSSPFYHFRCSVKMGFCFQKDFYAFCASHKQLITEEKKLSSPYQLRKLICIFSKSQAAFYHKWTGNVEERSNEKRLGEKPRVGAKKKRKQTEEDTKLSKDTDDSAEFYFFKMGALSIIELGHIMPRFHSSSHLFPIGFTSKRVYWSYKHPLSRTVYTCRILLPSSSSPSSSSPSSSSPSSSSPSSSSSLFTTPIDISASSHSQNPPPPLPSSSSTATSTTTASLSSSLHDASLASIDEMWNMSLPIFEISAADDPEAPIRTQSATQSWIRLLEKCGKRERYEMRAKNASGDTFSFGLSGHHFFGFGHPVIVQMLERLPQAGKCENYVFVNKDRRSQAADSDDDEGGDSEGEESEDLPLPINYSGCARTEGYDVYKTRDRTSILAKRAFLGPERSQTNQTDALQVASKDRKKNSTTTDRDERDKPVSSQYHIMKNKKGRTYVGQSSIHEWGLFSGEHLQPHTMVIEYLGDVIRQKVADVREKRYEASGEGSCYMFRIDKDSIVDGTKKGNTSRFINHSCDPNCYTKVISVDGAKKIIVFANRVIKVGDEVTYDYFFASEDTKNKITCNCGSYNCSGRLN